MDNGQLDSAACGHRLRHVSAGLRQREHVSETSGEGVAIHIPNVNDVKASRVALNCFQPAVAAAILTVGHDNVASYIEFHHVIHFASGDVDLYCVVHLDDGIVVANSPSIVSHNVRDTFPCEGLFHHLAEFGLRFLGIDRVELEAPFDIVHDTETIDIVAVAHGRFWFAASNHV